MRFSYTGVSDVPGVEHERRTKEANIELLMAILKLMNKTQSTVCKMICKSQLITLEII
jgi:hypothetical protein